MADHKLIEQMPRGIDEHPGFRSVKPKPELPPTFLHAAEAFGFRHDPNEPRAFLFRRKKGGTRIHIKQGRLTYLAHEIAAGFATAREWARAFAVEHGFVYRETKEF